jgi:hypothetical protein
MVNYLRIIKMKNMMIGLIGLLMSVNCYAGSIFSFMNSFDKNNGIHIDPAVQPYYDSFMKSAKEHGVDLIMNKLTIKLVNHDSEFQPKVTDSYLMQGNQEAFGACRYEKHEIVISRTVWNRFDDLERQAIVDHEMGHCYLGRKHDDKIKENGQTMYFESVMFSNDIVKGYYKRHQAYYRDELFDQSKFFQIGKE